MPRARSGWWAAFVMAAALSAQPALLHLDAGERERIDAALAAGTNWLCARVSIAGAIVPTQARVCRVAATALGLWAVAGAGHAEADALRPLARFLCARVQPDGGVYDPSHGLAVYTSGVAAAGLRAYFVCVGEQVDDLVRAAELFAQRASAPESVVDDEAAAREQGSDPAAHARKLLAQGAPLDDAERRAAEFLAGLPPATPSGAARARALGPRPDPAYALGAFCYDDLLAFVYETVKPEHQIHLRAMAAIRRDFVLEHNPDLTKRHGPDGCRAGVQGLFYYYLVLAKALAASGSPHIDLANGTRADWVRALTYRLLHAQSDGGSWVNHQGRWWEDDPAIVTSYALLALRLCRDMTASRVPAPRRN